ncbi:hypothetical protein [Rheinheimera sp.]|uniref:hypothetical protein n=1 Tax=Rheinheimera sp. TaxID=1869214 RepID=UPI00273241C4|nr:hypothetical protein [Rheinheimera sp.]MDP2715376.1 hypothetical protein [Rheinheimera sp.]
MGWDTIEALLFDLGKLVFVAYFLLFVLSVFVERKVSSLVISLMVLAVANGAMTALTPLLYELASMPGLFYKFLWYGVFVFIDCIAIFLLYKFHNLLRQSVSSIASIIAVAFLALASIQTLRFFDRFVSNTEVFQLVYQYGVPMINIMLVPLIAIFWAVNLKSANKNVQAAPG